MQMLIDSGALDGAIIGFMVWAALFIFAVLFLRNAVGTLKGELMLVLAIVGLGAAIGWVF